MSRVHERSLTYIAREAGCGEIWKERERERERDIAFSDSDPFLF